MSDYTARMTRESCERKADGCGGCSGCASGAENFSMEGIKTETAQDIAKALVDNGMTGYLQFFKPRSK